MHTAAPVLHRTQHQQSPEPPWWTKSPQTRCICSMQPARDANFHRHALGIAHDQRNNHLKHVHWADETDSSCRPLLCRGGPAASKQSCIKASKCREYVLLRVKLPHTNTHIITPADAPRLPLSHLGLARLLQNTSSAPMHVQAPAAITKPKANAKLPSACRCMTPIQTTAKRHEVSNAPLDAAQPCMHYLLALATTLAPWQQSWAIHCEVVPSSHSFSLTISFQGVETARAGRHVLQKTPKGA